MMTETEIQMVGYVEGILRGRGYADLADHLTEVTVGEASRRARLLSPKPAREEWLAAG